MPKLVKVQHLRYGGPILRFDDSIHLRDAADIVAKVFQQYLTKHKKENGNNVRARIITNRLYGIFIENKTGTPPVLEISSTENGSIYALKYIDNNITPSDIFESYLQNSVGK